MKLKVGHADVTVHAMCPRDAQGQECNGLWRPLFSSIHIRSDLDAQEQARVLIHELLHAIYHHHNLPEEMDQETTCGRLDRPLAGFFRDNPEILGTLHQALNRGVPIV